MKEAFDLIKERLEVEIESSDKYIREYDSSQVQIAWNKGMRKCLEIVSEVEAEYGNGWIPCSERLPEDNTRVLACFSSGTVTELAYLGEGVFSGLYEYTTKVIIAWMPLPEPYKGV